MAWNEPGGPKGEDPWGNRNKEQGPPDLDEIIRRIQDKFRRLFGGKGAGKPGRGAASAGGGPSFGGIGFFIMAAVLLWLAYDMVYIIEPAERGVVLRFGKYVETLQPGPSIRFPRPVENVVRLNVDQIQLVELGQKLGVKGRHAESSVITMLTKDQNILAIQLGVQYKIKDARDYLFNVHDPEETLSRAAESSLREVIGRNEAIFVLQEGRSEIASATRELMQSILDRYSAGVTVTSVTLIDAQPPDPVQEAYHDRIRAGEDKKRLINEAEAYANEVVPKARGEASRVTEDANAYRTQVVERAKGDTTRFMQVLTEYSKAPEVTRERIYLDSIESVLSKSSKIMVDVNKGNNVLYLPLDKINPRESQSPIPGVSAAVPSATDKMPPAVAPVPDESAVKREDLRTREVR